jgi:pyruvate,water dikinase
MVEKKGFPMPLDVAYPKELEGWEEMYPPYYIFSKERKDWEEKHFWYHDKIHAPEPMYPLDLIFHEAWQIALSQYTTRVFCIPPAQGVAQRMVGCYMYIAPVAPPPEDIIAEKAGYFQKRVFYVFDHYDALWGMWLKKFRTLGEEMNSIKVPEEFPKFEPDETVFPEPRGYYTSYEFMEAWDRLANAMIKGWQYHFQYLNLAYLAYLMFTDTCRKLFPGISESTIGKLVAGAYVQMFRPEEELCRLARLAAAVPQVARILKSGISPQAKIDSLKKTAEGNTWLVEYEKSKDPWFYVSCGSGWFHYEGSWLTKPEIPFGYLKGYIERIEKGEKVERDLPAIDKARAELAEEYRKLIKTDEDRNSFDSVYKAVRTIYKYAEDHLFWVEHWFHTIWFEKVRQFGRILFNNGVLKNVDDIYLFNRFEVPYILEDLATSWALGEGVPPASQYWQAKAEKRKKILEAAKKWSPSPALGTPPEEVAEPFTVMLWGITTERVQEWLKGVAVVPSEVTELKGFASSAGVVEGKVRVVKLLEEITKIEQGEILVCPTTNPAWAPVFTKIKASITDIGGLTSHAAIVCREYGVPSVTGTGIATSVLKTGDTVKVDGNTGIVKILKRA